MPSGPGHRNSLVRRRMLLAAAAGGMATRASAQPSAGVVFPRGASMGLRPPPGMVLSPRFSGFAEPGLPAAIHPIHAATIRFDENPLEPASTTLAGAADIIADHGVDVVSSRIVPHPDGFATLHHGTGAYTTTERSRVQVLLLPQRRFMGIAWFNAPSEPGMAYPPDAVDAALLSVRTRPQPSLEDRLAALTFTMADLAGLTVDDTSSSGGFTTSATLAGGDGGSFVQVSRQPYQPIPVPVGLTPGQAVRAAFPQPRRAPPRFDEPLGEDGWWFDDLYEQPGLRLEDLPWSITLLRYAPNGYLQVSANAHPRDRAGCCHGCGACKPGWRRADGTQARGAMGESTLSPHASRKSSDPEAAHPHTARPNESPGRYHRRRCSSSEARSPTQITPSWPGWPGAAVPPWTRRQRKQTLVNNWRVEGLAVGLNRAPGRASLPLPMDEEVTPC